MMLKVIFLILFVSVETAHESWNTSEILPWEQYLELGDIRRPLGLTLNRSSLAHRHFAIGYLCLHSFLYDEAQAAFDLSIRTDETFIEPYIGKLLGYKHPLWDYTNVERGRATYRQMEEMLNRTGTTRSPLQAALLSTAYKWYPDPNVSSTIDGELAFLSSITELSSNYVNETDILILWGLSLLNVADQARYQSTMEPLHMILARQVLINALEREPYHPGALHYLIHAYDVSQIDIAQQAQNYATSYGNIVKTASHAQHMPSHIWMRIGSWPHAISSDRTGVIASYALCATKLLNRSVTISSTQLQSVLSLFNTSNGTSFLYDCDRENRAHALEWLSYSLLQQGDWSNTISIIQDLFIANNQSTITPDHYRQFAYRARARAIIELFFWFPYRNEFANLTKQILNLNVSQTFIPVDNNTTRWYPIWGDAGWRFSECLQLLTTGNVTNDTISTVNEHLSNLSTLSQQANTSNKYISSSILMMISQIRGIQHYVNQSWQNCLNELNDAFKREIMLISDANTPTLIFARSSELLPMHLLLIYQTYQEQPGKNLSSTYMLNGTNVSVHDFPSRALALYQRANLSSPNRAINTLGTARANLQMGNNDIAKQVYQALLAQLTSSNTTNPIFSNEALFAITTTTTSTTASTTTSTTTSTTASTTTKNNNSALTNQSSFLLLIFILGIYYNS